MELVNYISNWNIIAFLLILIRMSALMLFFPFFSHTKINPSVKMALSVILAVFLLPFVPQKSDFSNLSIEVLFLQCLSELLFGLIAGLILNLIFAMLQLAGSQISMVMGFSMATVMDPQSGVNSPLISNFLSLLALTCFLVFDGHHVVLEFMAYSIKYVGLGSFMPSQSIFKYIMANVTNMFIFGFIMAFPILSISLLADMIFGMLMKTMPQFNLLVVGFPIKIAVAFSVLTAILSALMSLFTRLMTEALNALPSLFF